MPIEVSGFTKILMDQVQIFALSFMTIVYLAKVIWIFKFPASKEITPGKGNKKEAIKYAYLILALPKEMESTRKHWFRYAEFVAFHIGVAVAITVTFVMPYFPKVIGGSFMVGLIRFILFLALIAGISRMLRRFLFAEMRVISSIDDYFSIILLNIWLFSGFLAAPQKSEAALIFFFAMTAFFLIYVPFSKISHYLYWPFIRYYMGKHFGHRGVYPKKAVPKNA